MTLIDNLEQVEKDINKISESINSDINKNMVKLIQDKIDFKANVKTIETENELIGSIINIKV